MNALSVYDAIAFHADLKDLISWLHTVREIQSLPEVAK